MEHRPLRPVASVTRRKQHRPGITSNDICHGTHKRTNKATMTRRYQAAHEQPLHLPSDKPLSNNHVIHVKRRCDTCRHRSPGELCVPDQVGERMHGWESKLAGCMSLLPVCAALDFHVVASLFHSCVPTDHVATQRCRQAGAEDL